MLRYSIFGISITEIMFASTVAGFLKQPLHRRGRNANPVEVAMLEVYASPRGA
jgi:hypothetical protein